MRIFERIIEISFLLLIAYLVLGNSKGFSTIVNSLGGTYIAALRTFQGR